MPDDGLINLHCAAGLVQAIFTVSVLIFFIPIYYSFYLSLLWQVALLPTCPEHVEWKWHRSRVQATCLKRCKHQQSRPRLAKP